MTDPFSASESLTGELREIRFSLRVGDEAVPGLLIMPREGDDILPLVLIQHPATGSKDDYFVRDVALAWAKMGWACAGLDAPLHGERASHDPMSLLRDRERFGAVSRQFAAEVTAVIDALGERYRIDLSRLGYVGYSMGSMLGIPAVAADGRFRVAAFCLIGEGGLLGVAGDEDSPVLRLGRVAVRIVAKEQDEFFPRAASQALYEALPGERDIVWLPGGHFEIGPDVIQKAWEWVKPRI